MRAIEYKYAVALNLSIVNNEESYIYDAIEQALTIAYELDIQVCLTNPFNGKFVIFNYWEDAKDLFNKLK